MRVLQWATVAWAASAVLAFDFRGIGEVLDGNEPPQHLADLHPDHVVVMDDVTRKYWLVYDYRELEVPELTDSSDDEDEPMTP